LNGNSDNYVLQNINTIMKKSGAGTQEEFARQCGFSQSGLSKILASTRNPTDDVLRKIAFVGGVDVSDLQLNPEDFHDIINNITISSNLCMISLRTIKDNLYRCREVFKDYEGQYILYNSSSENKIFVASLLSLNRVTKEGIEFTLINPYKGVDGRYQTFKYKGFAFPVNKYLYLFAEQEDQDYEILTIILSLSSAPKVNILEGAQTGIGVLNDRAYVASTYCCCVKQNNIIKDINKELPGKLGYLKEEKISEMVKKNFTEDRMFKV